ncbi:MAG: hypothetical protein J5597_02780 [Spirochaetaceae bacterium]|nr:hypothetical protein [Spirochaetaceae bacterium]
MKLLKQKTLAFIGSVIYTAFVSAFVYAQTIIPLNTTAEAANRRTALLCLEESKNSILEFNWINAFDQADLGLSYDSAISDLWYVKAVAAVELNTPKAEVVSMLASALNTNEWIQYEKDAARVLYADLLSDTGRSSSALQILDAKPEIMSADADFIRAKSYYRINDRKKARTVISNAKNLYAHDGRFPLLFLETERTHTSESDVVQLAEYYIKNIYTWTDEYPELAVYAAVYSSSPVEREYLLKSFYARGDNHPLYTLLALQNGIISEQTAFSQILAFAQTGLRFDFFEDFITTVQTEKTMTELEEWMTAFAGTLLFDTNSDGIIDMEVLYRRGRAVSINYDENQDGVSTCKADCDFGVPYRIFMPEQNMTVTYESYPFVKTAEITSGSGTVHYDVNANELRWTPFEITQTSSPNLGVSFFIPSPKQKNEILSDRLLMAFSNTVTVPGYERDGSLIRFSMFEGKPRSAVYMVDAKPYAYGVFNEGILQFRTVDANNDGFYELTEYYAFNKEEIRNYISEKEEETLLKNIFGTINASSGIYLSETVIDTDSDGKHEYSEKYFADGKRIVSWDDDNDGNWDIKCIITKDAELTKFINPVNKAEITVTARKGTPVAVETPRGGKLIFRDDLHGEFYWIGKKLDSSEATKIINFFNLSPYPGVTIIEADGGRIVAARVGSFYFGELFDEE